MDHEHQVIVATRATNVSSDKQQAVVMIEEVIANTGTAPKEVSADAGYYSATAVAELQALGPDPFVAPEKTRHGHKPPLIFRPRHHSSDGLLECEAAVHASPGLWPTGGAAQNPQRTSSPHVARFT